MNNQPADLSNLGGKIGSALRKFAPQMILIVLLILFSILSPRFMSLFNMTIMVRQVSFMAISAVGIMFVMISGAIDLSIGSQIVLTNIVLAIMLAYAHIPQIVAIPLTLLLGTALGFINGFLSIKLKIHPLIITLGTSSIYQGIGYIVAASRNIIGLPKSFGVFGQGYIWLIPIPVVVMIVIAIIGSFILTKTYFGRYIFAMGGNPDAARLAGVNIDGMKLILFSMCGFISGITSILLLSRVFAGQVTTGQGLAFDCLTAALLGGISFIGGEGSVFGLITGVLIIGVLNNAMQIASFPDFSQTVVKGAVLLIAVAFDVYQKNRKARETVARVAVKENYVKEEA